MMHRQEVLEAPQGQRQAKRRSDWELFFAEECDEIRKLKGLETWIPELERNLPKGHRAIRMKWVYAIKRDPITGAIIKRKARLCVMGCFQQAGVDYFEVDARVANLCGIRICFAEWIADPENEMEWWVWVVGWWSLRLGRQDYKYIPTAPWCSFLPPHGDSLFRLPCASCPAGAVSMRSGCSRHAF